MMATTRMHTASPLSTASKVLVICWARLFPYTGLPAPAGVPAIRGAKAMPNTMRETLSTRRTPHSDEMTATGRERLTRLMLSQIASAAVTTSNAAIAALSYGERDRCKTAATMTSVTLISTEARHQRAISSKPFRAATRQAPRSIWWFVATLSRVSGANIAAATTHAR
jgi:hypothetical protein